MLKNKAILIITISLNFCFPKVAQAEEKHPRLFIEQTRIEQIRSAILVPDSHHQQAFFALKNRVEQNDWQVYGYDSNGGNWNYPRSHLAKESAFLYLITKLEGEGINAQLIIDNQTIVNYNEKSDRLDIIKFGRDRDFVHKYQTGIYYNNLNW